MNLYTRCDIGIWISAGMPIEMIEIIMLHIFCGLFVSLSSFNHSVCSETSLVN